MNKSAILSTVVLWVSVVTTGVIYALLTETAHYNSALFTALVGTGTVDSHSPINNPASSSSLYDTFDSLPLITLPVLIKLAVLKFRLTEFLASTKVALLFCVGVCLATSLPPATDCEICMRASTAGWLAQLL